MILAKPQRNSLFVLFLLVFSCSQKSDLPYVRHLQGTTMGTTYNIKIISEQLRSDTVAHKIKVEIDSTLLTINKILSNYDSDSAISKFNQFKTANTPYNVPAELYRVVESAFEIYQKSNGAFDITISPVVHLWGFGTRSQDKNIKPPSNEKIKKLLKLHNFKNLVIAGNSLTKKVSTIEIDVNAIAKGYGVDRLASFLQTKGFSNFMVEIGGEVVARGHNHAGVAWQIGIELHPEVVVNLNNAALATSGDYRSYRVMDGKRYIHIIDPRNGRPVSNKVVSVSIVAPNCMFADGVATTALVLGKEKGLQFLETLDNVEGYFILRGEGDKHLFAQTSGMNQWL